jgi:hypothetical protein
LGGNLKVLLPPEQPPRLIGPAKDVFVGKIKV